MLVDLVADRFIRGVPKRISREAPVLILEYQGETLSPGGGANAVANVAALGGAPLALGVVGDDESGDQLLDELGRRGVKTDGIVRRTGYRTPTKTRILGGGTHSIRQQIVRYDIEDSLELSEREVDHFDRKLEEWRGQSSLAVLSDYGYGVVEPRLMGKIRASLGAAGGRILCDSRYRLDEFKGLDGATPNEEETEELLGGPLVEDAATLASSGQALRRKLGAGFLLVTRGSHGMELFEDGLLFRIPVHGTDQVADVTGAGDTVIGTFALALAAGASALEAALLANYAAGVVVLKEGTATLTEHELGTAVEAGRHLLEEIRWEKC